MKDKDRKEQFPININGVDYTMSYNFNDICDGEQAAHHKWKQWHVNFFHIYFTPTQIHTVKDVFAASLELHHPEIPFDDRRKLVTLANFTLIVGIQFSVFGDAITKTREDKEKFAKFASFMKFDRRPVTS